MRSLVGSGSDLELLDACEELVVELLGKPMESLEASWVQATQEIDDPEIQRFYGLVGSFMNNDIHWVGYVGSDILKTPDRFAGCIASPEWVFGEEQNKPTPWMIFDSYHSNSPNAYVVRVSGELRVLVRANTGGDWFYPGSVVRFGVNWLVWQCLLALDRSMWRVGTLNYSEVQVLLENRRNSWRLLLQQDCYAKQGQPCWLVVDATEQCLIGRFPGSYGQTLMCVHHEASDVPSVLEEMLQRGLWMYGDSEQDCQG